MLWLLRHTGNVASTRREVRLSHMKAPGRRQGGRRFCEIILEPRFCLVLPCQRPRAFSASGQSKPVRKGRGRGGGWASTPVPLAWLGSVVVSSAPSACLARENARWKPIIRSPAHLTRGPGELHVYGVLGPRQLWWPSGLGRLLDPPAKAALGAGSLWGPGRFTS